jgi:FkbM family methyltransferase
MESRPLPVNITVAEHSFNVEPGPHKAFWSRVGRGAWEPETYAIFSRTITDRTLFLDIGAWIGSTSLYAAQLARKTVAFEPDPVAFKELSRNVAANADAPWADRIEINECAINRDGGSFVLGGSEAGADSTSSALFPDSASQWTVQARRLPDVLKAHRDPGQPVFLKIDIEGSEYDLLPSIADIIADPLVTAFISFHPKMLRMSLAPRDQREVWEGPYVERHMRILNALPWTRPIHVADGTPVDRQQLARKLRRRFRFPTELLIGGQ